MKIINFIQFILIGTTLFLTGCESDDPLPTDPDDPIVSSVTVSPSDAALQKGETREFEADVRDQDASVMTADVGWSTSDETVVTIDGEGMAQGAGPGTAEITATAEGVSGDASVVVEPPLDVTDVAFAFMSDRDGENAVWLMEADGGNPVRLTNHHLSERIVRWSPDGMRLAFDRRNEASYLDVWVVNADRSYPLNVTDSPSSMDTYPAWAPEGTRVAFTHDDGSVLEVWVIDPDGSNPVRLSSAGLSSGWHHPVWSPDGTRLVFEVGDFHNRDLWIMNADGSDHIQLTSTQLRDWMPDWSPDGLRIAFSRSTGDPDWEDDIWILELDGSDPVNLTDDPSTVDRSPQWSPDGTRILFTRGLRPPRSIWMMDADGSNQKVLTDGSSPQWSPDGTRIVFSKEGDIWIMNADGSNPTNLTDSPESNDFAPQWRPISTADGGGGP